MVRCRRCGKDWPVGTRACPTDGVRLDGHGDVDVSAMPTIPTPAPRGVTELAATSIPEEMSGIEIRGLGDLLSGTQVGEYEIVAKIGEGGMGSVYSATHPVIGKRAAIKVMNPGLGLGRDAIERFVTEARAVNQISHPNIVDVFAFGALPDGRCYSVMEWLQGATLGERLEQGAMPLDDALHILDSIGRALEAAHEKGIIHRDLKPDNVFLVPVRDDRPLVKLLDFGIAKLAGTNDVKIERTRTGTMMGTPLYMSPEQARGKSVDARTDIYALGAMAFEMIAGTPPFVAESAMEIVAMHLHQPPPSPRSVWPEVPPELDALVLAMLAKDPGARPSLVTIRTTLAEVRAGVGSGMTAEKRWIASPAPVVRELGIPDLKPSRRGWAVAGAMVVLAVAAVAGVRALRPTPPAAATTAPVIHATAAPAPAPAPPTTPPPPAPAPTGVLDVTANVANARVEVDGKLVAGAAREVRLTVTAGDHELEVTAPGRAPFRQVVTVGEGAVLKVPVRLARSSERAARTRTSGRVSRSKDSLIDPLRRR